VSTAAVLSEQRLPDDPGRAAASALTVTGLTPLTTVDYPGELAAVLFCQGCPWRCRYCHNGHLLSARASDVLPWAQVRDFLVGRRGLLDAVVFSGGEPTRQAALDKAAAEVRDLGFKIGLHTAGPYPGRLQRLLPWLDWVALDIKALPERYPEITGVPGSGERAWQSLELLLESGVALEVRTTMMPGWGFAEDLVPLMERLADQGVVRFVLQPMRAAAAQDPVIARRGDMPVPAMAADYGAARFPSFLVRPA